MRKDKLKFIAWGGIIGLLVALWLLKPCISAWIAYHSLMRGFTDSCSDITIFYDVITIFIPAALTNNPTIIDIVGVAEVTVAGGLLGYVLSNLRQSFRMSKQVKTNPSAEDVSR